MASETRSPGRVWLSAAYARRRAAVAVEDAPALAAHSPVDSDIRGRVPSAAAPWQSRLRRLAFAALVLLCLTFGLGDIAAVSPITSVLLNAVHALLLATIVLALVARIATRSGNFDRGVASRRWPSYARELSQSVAVWLLVLVASAGLAATHRLDALAALDRPATGALLVWTVYELCGARGRWLRVAQAFTLGGLFVAASALAEATGFPVFTDVLGALRDGPIPIGDVPRVAATLSHPNEAAMLLELTLPLAIAWCWSAPRRWRAPPLFAAAALLLALVLTFSRAGIVVALGELVVLGALYWYARDGPAPRLSTNGTARWRLLSLGGLALVVPLALGWASIADPGLGRRLMAGVDESSAIQPARTEFWSVAISMFRSRPLLGIGPDNFRWQFVDYSGVPQDNLGIHAHDQYLEALADTGVAGALSLAWVFVVSVRLALRRLRTNGADWPWRAAMLASLGAWLAHALVDDFERFWPTSVAFWLVVALTVSCPKDSADAVSG